MHNGDDEHDTLQDHYFIQWWDELFKHSELRIGIRETVFLYSNNPDKMRKAFPYYEKGYSVSEYFDKSAGWDEKKFKRKKQKPDKMLKTAHITGTYIVEPVLNSAYWIVLKLKSILK